ncbi:hypothetical protein [Methylophaga sp.]|uniref:hypothetical protein n=1 Tax=Methylophaga sp. TaxID=2024840 RepID=UPI003A8EDEA8
MMPPHIGTPKGVDKNIKLNPNEHILEKSFILYSKEYKAFALQSSQTFRGPGCFTDVVNSQGLSENVTVSVVLEKTTDKKFNKNLSSIAKFVVAVENPSTKKAAANDDWGNDVLSVADGATGRFEIMIKGDMRGTVGHPLPASSIKKIRESISTGMYTKAVATTTTGEDIDIINNRLRAKIHVEMLGKYPSQRSVHDELIRVFDDQANELVHLKN